MYFRFDQMRYMNKTHVNSDLCMGAATRVEGGGTGCAMERHAVSRRSLDQIQAKCTIIVDKKDWGA